MVDYGACAGNSVLSFKVKAAAPAAAPAGAPGPAAPGGPRPAVGEVVEVTADDRPSKGLAFEIIQDDADGGKLKLQNGKWYRDKDVKHIPAAEVTPVQARNVFCRHACTPDGPVIPTYPGGKLDTSIPPTVTDPNPKCLHDCRDGADLVMLCKGLCPTEGGMCLTECETKMQRCEDSSRQAIDRGASEQERHACVKKTCKELSFNEKDIPQNQKIA